jgi:hypothetical protein
VGKGRVKKIEITPKWKKDISNKTKNKAKERNNF